MTRLLCCALALATGCTLIVEGEVGDLDVNLNAKRDVRVILLDMDPHIGQFVDVQIVRPPEPDSSDASIQARAVFDGLPSNCVELFWPLGAALSATRVDFYADLNGDGMLSPPGDDHLWRRELDDDGEFRFIHDIEFDDIGADPADEIGFDLDLELTGLDAHNGQTLVVAVLRSFRVAPGEPQLTSVPGILVIDTIEGGAVSSFLPGIIDGGADHVIELNFGDGANVCRMNITAPASGSLEIRADLASLECGLSDPQPVFEDVSAREGCME